MPLADRQFQPGEDPAAQVLARVWRQAPVGLALMEGGALAAWNPEARRLLEGAIGGAPPAWQRWLEAAAVRQLAAPEAPSLHPARCAGAPPLELAVAADGRPDGVAVLVLRTAPAPAAPDGGRNLAETVSTLSHELRTPLASMKGSLALLLRGDAGDLNRDQERFLGVALRNVTRLDRLVGDLLDVSRDDAGRLSLTCRVCDLGPVLRDALALYDGEGPQQGPRVDSTGIPRHFQACVDPDRVTQIVANLVGNARKYVPADGRVRVWLDAHAGPLEPLAAALASQCGLEARTFTLVVEDNGPGIDPQVVDRVFEPFERGRTEVIGHIGGAGLGLHIVRRLAEAHGGKVSLATAPGAGTTVWVRLPLDAGALQLLQTAASVRNELGTMVEPAPWRVAMLDGRDEGAGDGARTALAVAALDRLPAGAVGRPLEAAARVLALAVREPGAWDGPQGLAAAGWRPLEAWRGEVADRVPVAIAAKPGPARDDSDA